MMKQSPNEGPNEPLPTDDEPPKANCEEASAAHFVFSALEAGVPLVASAISDWHDRPEVYQEVVSMYPPEIAGEPEYLSKASEAARCYAMKCLIEALNASIPLNQYDVFRWLRYGKDHSFDRHPNELSRQWISYMMTSMTPRYLEAIDDAKPPLDRELLSRLTGSMKTQDRKAPESDT